MNQGVLTQKQSSQEAIRTYKAIMVGNTKQVLQAIINNNATMTGEDEYVTPEEQMVANYEEKQKENQLK